MNARQLEIFHAVMRSGTLTGAASFLGITQPAVSKALHLAERKLGFRLLRPMKGRLYPTPEAERLLPDADRIMRDLAAFQRLTGEVKAGGAGLLRVAASSSIATVLLPMATAQFRKTHPGLRISFHLLTAREVAEAVSAGEVDFGLVLSPVQLPGLSVRSLGATEMICIAPAGHALLDRAVLGPADLAPHPLISFGAETYFGQLLDQAFEAAGLKREIMLQVTMSIVAACHIQQGGGVALVDSMTRHLSLAGLGWRPFRPMLRLPVTLMTAGNHPLSRLSGAFIEVVERVLEADRKALARPEASGRGGALPQSRRLS